MEKIKDDLERHAKDGKISCVQALEIAERLGEKPAVIGKLLNKLNIKIKGCQLGCFK